MGLWAGEESRLFSAIRKGLPEEEGIQQTDLFISRKGGGVGRGQSKENGKGDSLVTPGTDVVPMRPLCFGCA